MLNYKNDPLLLGKETANDLIRNKKSYLVFLDKEKEILNLFSAFVKKDDFVKKDKRNQILQKTVYVKINKNLTKAINRRFSNKKKLIGLLETYLDKRCNLKKALKRWFKNKIFPLILLKIISKDKKEFSTFIDKIEYFTDFLGKSRFYCHKTLGQLLDYKLMYFIGCSIGDGHINKEGKRWVLVDGSSKKERLVFSEKFILNLTFLLKNLINNYEIKRDKTKYALRINNKLFCRFLNFFFGLPFGKKKDVVLKKPFILNLRKNDLEKYFWRGCFDTDGSVNKWGAVDFCSSDRNLLNKCMIYLKTIKIEPKKGKNLLVINISDLKKFSQIGFSHPRKQKEFLEILKRGSKFIDIKIRDSEKIDKRLLKIYNLIRVDNNYRIRIHSRNLKSSKLSEEKVKQIIKELFGYELKKTTKNLLYFKSKKVYEYLNKHFIFEPYWKPISSNEEIKLLSKWNEVWN